MNAFASHIQLVCTAHATAVRLPDRELPNSNGRQRERTLAYLIAR